MKWIISYGEHDKYILTDEQKNLIYRNFNRGEKFAIMPDGKVFNITFNVILGPYKDGDAELSDAIEL